MTLWQPTQKIMGTFGLAVLCFLNLGADSSRAVLLDIQRFDQALVDAEATLKRLQAEQDNAKEALASAEIETATLRMDYEVALQHYKKRMQAIERMPRGARLAVLGGASSLQDYLQRSRALRLISQHDHSLLMRLKEQEARLQKQEEALAEAARKIQASVQSAQILRDTIAQKRQEKLELLRRLHEDHRLLDLSRKERIQAQSSLGVFISRLRPRGTLRHSFAQNRGRLPWPVAGKVLLAYGQQFEDDHGTTILHQGIDLQAPSGTPVQAIADGEVVFSGWKEGYGQLLIVDHGEGFHSLYAHLGSILGSEGHAITGGTHIGTVGDTGSLRGTLLYFELRHHGKPLDPKPWLRRP